MKAVVIYLNEVDYKKIIEHAKKEFPNECCGFLAGLKIKENTYIKKIYPITNTDQSSEHFLMDTKEQFSTVKVIREEKMILIGNYHSHPFSHSRPSEEDKRFVFDPNIIYAILSLEIEIPIFNLFQITKYNVINLEYKIVK